MQKYPELSVVATESTLATRIAIYPQPASVCSSRDRPRYYLSVLERQLESQLNDARTARRDIALRRARIGQRLRDLSVVAVSESGSPGC